MADPQFGTRHLNFVDFDVTYRDAVDWVAEAEEIGYQSVHIPDRLVARSPGVYESTTYDPTVSLASYAARTESIQLGPMVLVGPYRRPINIAKMYGSLDIAADGRLVLAIGAGWNPQEFGALGVLRSKRGRILEETVEILTRLWTEDDVTYDGDVFSFEDVTIEPKPIQDPHPPIWFGSFSPSIEEFTPNVDRALARVGRLGDGWAPLVYSADVKQRIAATKLGKAWERIAESARRHDRDPGDIEIVLSHWFYVTDDDRGLADALSGWFSGTTEEAKDTYLIGTPEEVARQATAIASELPRVDRFTLGPLSYDAEQLHRFSNEVVPLIKDRF